MFSKQGRKSFLSSIAEDGGAAPNVKGNGKSESVGKIVKSVFENSWNVLFALVSVVLIYILTKLFYMQRRIRDLESRPPVDDITLRGSIRDQLNEMVSDLEQTLRAKEVVEQNKTNVALKVVDRLEHFKSKSDKKGAQDFDQVQNPTEDEIVLELAKKNSPHSLPTVQIIETELAKRIDSVDDEIQQVRDIANSLKSSLPDLNKVRLLFQSSLTTHTQPIKPLVASLDGKNETIDIADNSKDQHDANSLDLDFTKHSVVEAVLAEIDKNENTVIITDNKKETQEKEGKEEREEREAGKTEKEVREDKEDKEVREDKVRGDRGDEEGDKAQLEQKSVVLNMMTPESFVIPEQRIRSTPKKRSSRQDNLRDQLNDHVDIEPPPTRGARSKLTKPLKQAP